MTGMSRTTGRALDDQAHLRQSIADILTTPIGSRLMRRDYGSQLPELIDQPFNELTKLRAYAAIAIALMRWEPRIRLARVQIFQAAQQGGAVIELEGERVDNNAPLNLQVPLQMGAAA